MLVPKDDFTWEHCPDCGDVVPCVTSHTPFGIIEDYLCYKICKKNIKMVREPVEHQYAVFELIDTR